jgi:hypothetical protein
LAASFWGAIIIFFVIKILPLFIANPRSAHSSAGGLFITIGAKKYNKCPEKNLFEFPFLIFIHLKSPSLAPIVAKILPVFLREDCSESG